MPLMSLLRSKTYSMMGGGEKFEDRGLIPRAISYIFDWISANSSQFQVSVRISFMEVREGREGRKGEENKATERGKGKGW